MEQNDEFNQVVREIVIALSGSDGNELGRIRDRALGSVHGYDTAVMVLLGQAAQDETLPVLDADGELVRDPATRFTKYLGRGHVPRVLDMERTYSGQSTVAEKSLSEGDLRRGRAWAAYQMAVMFYSAAETTVDEALWCERALGLDMGSAAKWGAWYCLYQTYLNISESAVLSDLDDYLHKAAALEWVVDICLEQDPKCRDFLETKQNLQKFEATNGLWLMAHRCDALLARGRVHDDGFAGKFLFESALTTAQSDTQRVDCHGGIATDITMRRYEPYNAVIEQISDDEISVAEWHAGRMWDLAQSLVEARTFTQQALRDVKQVYDCVRTLRRECDLTRWMPHDERQAFLDKRQQAGICRESGDLDRALELLNWCLARVCRDPLLWWSKGKIFVTPGKRDLNEAMNCFQQAVGLDPEDSDYWCSLATALINTGQSAHLDAAIRCCQKGLERNRACDMLKRSLALAMQKKQGV